MVRSWPIVLALLMALALVAATPAPALAEDTHPKQAEPNMLAPRLDLMIWTVVVFVALLLVLKKFAWKPMLEGLQGREAKIRGVLDEAQTARDEAQKMRADLQVQLAEIQDKMRQMMDESRRDGQALKDRMIAEAKAEAQAEHDRRLREFQREAEQARQELWSQTAQLATLVSAKVVGRSLNADDHRNLVDEAVAELGGTSAQRTTA